MKLYRWPFLCSPTTNPRNFVSDSMAQINGRLMQGELLCSRPEFEMIAVTVTPTAMVMSRR
jgi:hypothetical protein